MLTTSNVQLIAQWKASVEDFAVRDIRTCLERDMIEVGLVILTLTAIESLSGYFCGKRADKSTFVNFLKSDYFSPQYGRIADRLYPLRNGLFHDYATDENKFILFRTREQGFEHLTTSTTAQGVVIALNREIMANDFLSAWKRFADDATQYDHVAANVLTRIRDVDRGFLVVRDVDVYSPPLQQDQAVEQPSSLIKSYSRSTYTGGTVSNRDLSARDNNGS